MESFLLLLHGSLWKGMIFSRSVWLQKGTWTRWNHENSHGMPGVTRCVYVAYKAWHFHRSQVVLMKHRKPSTPFESENDTFIQQFYNQHFGWSVNFFIHFDMKYGREKHIRAEHFLSHSDKIIVDAIGRYVEWSESHWTRANKSEQERECEIMSICREQSKPIYRRRNVMWGASHIVLYCTANLRICSRGCMGPRLSNLKQAISFIIVDKINVIATFQTRISHPSEAHILFHHSIRLFSLSLSFHCLSYLFPSLLSSFFFCFFFLVFSFLHRQHFSLRRTLTTENFSTITRIALEAIIYNCNACCSLVQWQDDANPKSTHSI